LNRLQAFYSTVTHPSTNHARHCLTSVIGREPVFSMRHGKSLFSSILSFFH
jgi:hypothetical protein